VIEAISWHKQVSGVKDSYKYQIKWKCYDDDKKTSEPATNVSKAIQLLGDYHKQHRLLETKVKQIRNNQGCWVDGHWLEGTFCCGVDDKWVYSFVFEQYLKLFRRDIMWWERKDWHKVQLCGEHGPERGMSIFTQLSGSAGRYITDFDSKCTMVSSCCYTGCVQFGCFFQCYSYSKLLSPPSEMVTVCNVFGIWT